MNSARYKFSANSDIDCSLLPCYLKDPFGAVAQLGERVNGIHEVSGSIPLSSTIIVTRRPGEVIFPGLFIYPGPACGSSAG